MAAVQEAVEIRRALTKTNPDAHLPNLASALHNLSIDLGEMGRREEGLTAVREAVSHYRVLANANPHLFGPALQRSLDVTAWLEGLEP
ncbi:hypothetical protein OG245_37625 (plasmid) [Streptomyces sp. NBC_01116]|uniref:hypothetical protein n=1 Tax=Streptomyces sp. NBC_01116 TaxID=2903752 RepID=UPI002F913132